MSARKRGASGLSGILLVDKPAGVTSHDVVSRVRRITGEGRVGHAGTLDPMATGLLVVLVGPAARLAPYLTAAEKSYDARIVFGSQTDTDDAEGSVTAEKPVPVELADPEVAAAHVAGLVGVHEQVPPAFSAIKRGGVVAHRAARSGEAFELESRRIEVLDARLLGVEVGPPVAWDVALRVSKGTYVRALARDLGHALGTAAHLGALRRTGSGTLALADAYSLEALASTEDVAARFADPVAALGLQTLEVDPDAIANGVRLPRDLAPQAEAGEVIAVVAEGRLLALYRATDTALAAEVVLPGGVTGGVR